MTAAGLLVELHRLGVRITPDAAGHLDYDAPAGVMTPGRLELLRTHRDDVADLLERIGERAAIAEHDGGLSAEDAERLAWADLLGADGGAVVDSDLPVLAGVLCPWCRGGDRLSDTDAGLRCGRCDRLAWAWLLDGSLCRCDWTDRLIDSV